MMISRFKGIENVILESFESQLTRGNQYYNAMLLKLFEIKEEMNATYNNSMQQF
jgi:hypothetical protein